MLGPDGQIEGTALSFNRWCNPEGSYHSATTDRFHSGPVRTRREAGGTNLVPSITSDSDVPLALPEVGKSFLFAHRSQGDAGLEVNLGFGGVGRGGGGGAGGGRSRDVGRLDRLVLVSDRCERLSGRSDDLHVDDRSSPGPGCERDPGGGSADGSGGRGGHDRPSLVVAVRGGSGRDGTGRGGGDGGCR